MAENKELPIRSVTRALHVLQAINRHGSLSMTQISNMVELPYPTTCRIVNTLISEGVIERETSRKYYRPTALTQSLSCGYQPRVRLVAIAREHVEALTRDTGWPVSIASRVGSSMVIQDSTHGMTTMTFSDYHPGYTLPILSSASGMAYLAFTTESERNEILRQLEEKASEEEIHMFGKYPEPYFEIIRKDGYASFIRNPHTKDPGKTSSIAVPLVLEETVIGALTLVFFSTTLKVTDAFEKYKEALFQAQKNINDDLVKLKLFKPEELGLG
jgi:IclR family mhp operon transcriptional activator